MSLLGEESPNTIEGLLRWAIRTLSSGPTDTPRLDAEILIGHVLGKTAVQLITASKEAVSSDVATRIQGSIERRRSGEPVAYITGEKEFFGRSFAVSKDVLIPRPDTEVLVAAALELWPRNESSSRKVLEVGTGSGAICLTLAAERPNWMVESWDISRQALAVAQTNAQSLHLTNVDLRNCDGLNPYTWSDARRRYSEGIDLICSNPPYISEDERSSIAPSVLNFEPEVALFCPTGLEFYKTIAHLSRDVIAPGGYVLCEIGWTQALDVVGIFREQEWERVSVRKDLAGNDRLVIAQAPVM